MTKSEIIAAVKKFCEANKFIYAYDIAFYGNSVGINIKGDSDKYNAFLDSLGLIHDRPTEMLNGIISYIKFDV